MRSVVLVALLAPGLFHGAGSLHADEFAIKEVGIGPERPSVIVETASGDVEIQRNQDQEHRLTGEYALTSRACPPFCVQPMLVARGVETIGELELLDLLQDADALVVDSRTQKWYRSGTIPGSVHVPHTDIIERLDEFGCEREAGRPDTWNCTNATTAALFCNGPWCPQSPTAIRAMLGAGYPAEKLLYYRGGMQMWHVLGLTVVNGDS